MNNHLVSFADIRQTAQKHWVLAVAALSICLFLEFWFYNHPPRGVLTEDTIILGSIAGEPLVKFDSLWSRTINDDSRMLEIFKSALMSGKGNPASELAQVTSLRRSLRYAMIGETMVRISIIRPGYDGRAFLNCFTAFLLEQLASLGEERLKMRRETVSLRYTSLSQKAWVVADAFGLAGFKDILENFDNFETLYRENLKKSDKLGPWQSVGWLLLNSWLTEFQALRNNYRQHFSDNIRLLDIFPRLPKQISSPDARSAPVQPFHQLIYILVPCAIGLVYLSALLLLSQSRGGARD